MNLEDKHRLYAFRNKQLLVLKRGPLPDVVLGIVDLNWFFMRRSFTMFGSKGVQTFGSCRSFGWGRHGRKVWDGIKILVRHRHLAFVFLDGRCWSEWFILIVAVCVRFRFFIYENSKGCDLHSDILSSTQKLGCKRKKRTSSPFLLEVPHSIE